MRHHTARCCSARRWRLTEVLSSHALLPAYRPVRSRYSSHCIARGAGGGGDGGGGGGGGGGDGGGGGGGGGDCDGGGDGSGDRMIIGED